MDAPKPDEEIPAWQYLDIYLFSNGQENSPPRKYHLVSEHLDYWRETMKELAQEQFGSPDYDINLYTTQGRLIQTPLELNHKKAYVAVRSPEEFIDTGYDRYLIRATRSWEKRQDKRSNNTAEKPGEDLLTGKSDPESIAATPSITLKTIIPSVEDNQGSVNVKPRDRNTSSSKQLDRAERTFIQRSSLSKKKDTAPSPVMSTKTPTQRRDSNMHNDETADQSTTNKTPFKGRVHNFVHKRRNSEAVLSKVEEVVNQLENSSPRKVEPINAKTKRYENRARIPITKPVENEKDQQNKPKTIPHLIGNRPRVLMTKPFEDEKDQHRGKFKPFSSSIENRNRTAINAGENVKIEQTKPKIMPHLNENQLDPKVVNPHLDAEQHFSENNQTLGAIVHKNENVINVGVPLNISNNNKSNQQNYNNDLVQPVLPSSTEKKQKPRDKSDNISKAGNYFNILNKNNDDPLKKETLSHPVTPTMTNTLSDLSKGIINMRIEVWNSSDVTRNASCEIKAPVIILTNEIGSQVDMSDPTGQNKVLHQVIASDKDGIEGNYKVILVRSSYPNNNACEISKHTVIGECVMFLPVIKLDELYCRCSGGETNVIAQHLSTSSNDRQLNPAKKSASFTSMHKENANRISIDIHHKEIRPDSADVNLNEDTIQDKTDPSKPKLSTDDKKCEESTKTLENSSMDVESVKTSESHILIRNSECMSILSKFEVPPNYTLDLKEDERETEYSVSQPHYGKPVDSEEPKSKQINTHATQPETKESVTWKISKFSEKPVVADLVKETKSDKSVEIIHSNTEELNINEPELSSAHAASDELSTHPSADSVDSKRIGITECQESTLQSNTETTKASAVAEATSLLETRLEPAKPLAITQDKASQTEWTDVLWEAKLQEDGHYSFHLPTLLRLKEYNL